MLIVGELFAKKKMFIKTIHARHWCWILWKNIKRKFNEMRSIGEKIGSYNLIMILSIKAS